MRHRQAGATSFSVPTKELGVAGERVKVAKKLSFTPEICTALCLVRVALLADRLSRFRVIAEQKELQMLFAQIPQYTHAHNCQTRLAHGHKHFS